MVQNLGLLGQNFEPDGRLKLGMGCIYFSEKSKPYAMVKDINSAVPSEHLNDIEVIFDRMDKCNTFLGTPAYNVADAGNPADRIEYTTTTSYQVYNDGNILQAAPQDIVDTTIVAKVAGNRTTVIQCQEAAGVDPVDAVMLPAQFGGFDLPSLDATNKALVGMINTIYPCANTTILGTYHNIINNTNTISDMTSAYVRGFLYYFAQVMKDSIIATGVGGAVAVDASALAAGQPAAAVVDGLVGVNTSTWMTAITSQTAAGMYWGNGIGSNDILVDAMMNANFPVYNIQVTVGGANYVLTPCSITFNNQNALPYQAYTIDPAVTIAHAAAGLQWPAAPPNAVTILSSILRIASKNNERENATQGLAIALRLVTESRFVGAAAAAGANGLRINNLIYYTGLQVRRPLYTHRALAALTYKSTTMDLPPNLRVMSLSQTAKSATGIITASNLFGYISATSCQLMNCNAQLITSAAPGNANAVGIPGQRLVMQLFTFSFDNTKIDAMSQAERRVAQETFNIPLNVKFNKFIYRWLAGGYPWHYAGVRFLCNMRMGAFLELVIKPPISCGLPRVFFLAQSFRFG